MTDPIYLLHVLVATALLVTGLLLIVDGISETMPARKEDQ